MGKMLFRRVSSDYQTKELINSWMIRTGVRYRVFARILEKIGLKGPFRCKSFGGLLSDSFTCKTSDGKKYKVLLIFPDENSLASLWIRYEKTTYFFFFKHGKIYKNNNFFV